MQNLVLKPAKAILGLGNPGSKFENTRHNIGFKVLDTLAQKYGAEFKEQGDMELARLFIYEKPVLLIKPQTFMNNSGAVMPYLRKQGIEPDDILVVHDELEMPFGKIAIRLGGSARGHNGLRSIIAACGEKFYRLRFGIGRPERKEDVGNFVLQKFNENPAELAQYIDQSVQLIESLYK